MAARSMRAIIADQPGGAGVLRLVELPVPEPGLGQMRLRVLRCGLNPIDLMARRGAAPWIATHWPLVLGIEHNGVVEAVGEGVDSRWLGKTVTSNTVFGGNAEYSLVPAAKVIESPEGVDEDARAVYRGSTHTAHRLLELYGPAPGSAAWILVHSAAGTLGPVVTQMARARGHRVIGITSSQAKAAWAKQFGANEMIVAIGEDWVEPVKAATAGQGVALIIDGNGGPAAARNIELLAPLGTCVFVGASSGVSAPAIDPRRLIMVSGEIAGFNLPIAEAAQDDAAEVDAAVVAMMRAGTLRIPINRIATLDEVPELHRALEARELMGRTVIRMAG